MEIEEIIKINQSERDTIGMILSNNINLMYKGKACISIDNWDKLTDELIKFLQTLKHEN